LDVAQRAEFDGVKRADRGFVARDGLNREVLMSTTKAFADDMVEKLSADATAAAR
jgi:hypothetical protein